MLMIILCSHVCWRRLVKHEQRRRRRQTAAKARDAAQNLLQKSPRYQARVAAEQAAADVKQEKDELAHKLRKAEFQARDLALHSLFLYEKAMKEGKIQQIRKDQAKIPKSASNGLLASAETSEKSQLLQQTRDALGQSAERSQNPEPPRPAIVPPQQEVCPFFSKTGACRFGDRCSRCHVYPAVSCTLLLPGMYVAPGQLPDSRSDSDAMLEYDEADRRLHFREFFLDVTDEARKFGRICEVRVCANSAAHLRGNLYIRYERTSDACAAAAGLHGRYYGGKIVSVIFVPLESLRNATCGLFFRNMCHKGGECNFIHPYPNPDGAYFSDPRRGLHDRSGASGPGSDRRPRSSSPRPQPSRATVNGRPARSSRSSRNYTAKRSRSPGSTSSKRSRSPGSTRSKRSGSPGSSRSKRSRSPGSSRSRRSRSPGSSRSRRSRSSGSTRSKRSGSPGSSRSKRSRSPGSSRSRRSRSPGSTISKRSRSPGFSRSRRSRSPGSSRSKRSRSPGSTRSKRSRSPGSSISKRS
ncbi:splicing factor U2af small subunit A [Hyalella azteca]|uniref:Splicing factor U2af small subunit A n=1 Tax=Hyalella azteca TaxID=294128 RepID=A0A8B7NFE2_HYAAZ|nr:splicing factor U2af small subunit A [Hyalella azteca]